MTNLEAAILVIAFLIALYAVYNQYLSTVTYYVYLAEEKHRKSQLLLRTELNGTIAQIPPRNVTLMIRIANGSIGIGAPSSGNGVYIYPTSPSSIYVVEDGKIVVVVPDEEGRIELQTPHARREIRIRFDEAGLVIGIKCRRGGFRIIQSTVPECQPFNSANIIIRPGNETRIVRGRYAEIEDLGGWKGAEIYLVAPNGTVLAPP